MLSSSSSSSAELEVVEAPLFTEDAGDEECPFNAFVFFVTGPVSFPHALSTPVALGFRPLVDVDEVEDSCEGAGDGVARALLTVGGAGVDGLDPGREGDDEATGSSV